ncbi:MAG: thiosulfate oxidation carrier protein SoxY [Pseudomonadales bacterium]
MTNRAASQNSRRALLKGVGAAWIVTTLPSMAAATPASMQQAIIDRYGSGKIQPGKVTLKVPALAENGNSVAVTVTVDSPMQGNERVRNLTLFAVANPLPVVTELQFGPLAARAEASFRVRLADTQRLLAVAQMQDGTLWSGSATTIVTLAACTDFLF